MEMPREADKSWPFSQGQCVAVGATHPVLLPAATGRDRQAHSCFPLQQPRVPYPPAAGGTWSGPAQPLGRSVSLGRDAVCAAASCVLEFFSPSCAVLGQGELVWGVTGVSSLTVMLAQSCGAAAGRG